MEKGLLYRSRLNGHRYQVPHHPELEGDVEIRDSEIDPPLKLGVNKRNLPRIYASLYSRLYGGELGLDRAQSPNYGPLIGVNSQIVPDVIYEDSSSTLFSEIKVVFRGDRRPLFSLPQVQNLSYLLAHSIEEEIPLPEVKMGLFVYGSLGEKRAKLGLEDRTSLRKRVTLETESLIVFPFNLALYLFMHPSLGDKPLHDHSSSIGRNEESYYRLKISTVGKLTSGQNGLQELLQDYQKGRPASFTACRDQLLCLDDLVVETRTPPERLFLGSHRMRPFKIVEYRNQDPHAWNDAFREHSELFLEEMGLQTLAEAREEKKQRDLLRQAQQKSAESASSGAQEDDELPF